MNNIKIETHKMSSGKPIIEILIEELKKGHTVRMNIKGNSMAPLIKISDVVVVKPIKFDEIKAGDIVVYSRRKHHEFTLHRLIKMSRDKDGRKCLSTKGDKNRHGDFPVYPEEVCGKATTIERKDGSIINLDTVSRRLHGYILAKRYWLARTLRFILKSPHLVPAKVLEKVTIRHKAVTEDSKQADDTYQLLSTEHTEYTEK